MTAPVPVYPGSTLELTRRTIEGRFYLRPDPQAVAIIAYLVAHYAKKYGLQIMSLVVMSNHIHIVLYDPRGLYPCFTRDVNSWITRLLNPMRDRTGALFEPGTAGRTRLLDLKKQWDKNLYVALNPVAAGLVPDARKWPGYVCSLEDAGETLTFRRPKAFEGSRTFPEFASFEVALPVELRGKPTAHLRRRFRKERLERQKNIARARAAEGKRFLGVQRAMQVDAETKPRRPLAKKADMKKRNRAVFNPLFAASTPDLRAAAAQQLRAFRGNHRACLIGYRTGETDIVWPPGTFYKHVIDQQERAP